MIEKFPRSFFISESSFTSVCIYKMYWCYTRGQIYNYNADEIIRTSNGNRLYTNTSNYTCIVGSWGRSVHSFSDKCESVAMYRVKETMHHVSWDNSGLGCYLIFIICQTFWGLVELSCGRHLLVNTALGQNLLVISSSLHSNNINPVFQCAVMKSYS